MNRTDKPDANIYRRYSEPRRQPKPQRHSQAQDEAEDPNLRHTDYCYFLVQVA